MEGKYTSGRILVALDVDHTLIDANADMSMKGLTPDGCIPNEIQALHKSRDFLEYMRNVFSFLHGQGVSGDRIEKHVQDLPLVPGITDLFEHLGKTDCYDVIILSDGNSVLVSAILKRHKLDSVVSKVFTNPAEYNDNGCLVVKEYHLQDWCQISTVNLCKGRILKDYIKSCNESGKNYSSVVYVGDGANDLCPALTLSNKDYLFPRKGFALSKKLEDRKTNQELLPEAQVHEWESAEEIKNFLQQLTIRSGD